MDAAGQQTTLADFDLTAPAALQTTPARYLHTNDRPATEPTYIAHVPPAEPRDATPDREPPGEQAELFDFAGTCPFCTADPDSLEKHYLLEHPAAVNDRIAEIKGQQEDAPADPDPEPLRVNPEPVAFDRFTGPDHGGQRLQAEDQHACAECGQHLSHKYVSIFGFDAPNREPKCRNCEPRSRRFSMDPAAPHPEHSQPLATGSDNHRSSARAENQPDG